MCVLDFIFGIVIGVIFSILALLFFIWYTTKKIEKQ